MAEKNKKNNHAANENEKPEKKMTKYDLKMQRRREEEERAKRRSKITRTVGVLVAILCVCGIVWKAFDSYQEKNGPYVSIGDHEIDRAEFDYYYYSSVNSFASTYGSYASYFGLDLSSPLDQQSYSEDLTWKDYFEQEAVSQLQYVYALTDEAAAQGFEYDASGDYEELVDSINTYAESEEMTADEYCQAVFGENATLENIKPYVEQSSLASAYYESVSDATEITEDEINTYYDENKENYDSVDYRICKIAADMPEEETEAETEAAGESAAETETETMSAEESEALAAEQEAAEEAAMAEAKAKADDMLSKISDEASFEAIYADYAEDTTVDSLKTNQKKSSISPSDVADWLFDSSRQEGDTTVIEYTSGDAYYVVYFIDRYLEHAKTVDVRHILISADAAADETETLEDTDTAAETEAVDETESAEEQEAAEAAAMAEAKAKAEEIYAEWSNGEATEDSFAQLAETYSDDAGSVDNGGLYEAVKDGDMVTSFNDWIFDAARQPGDTDIVESDYGYHIMYFVGDNAEEWYVSIKDTLLSNKMNDWMAELTETQPVTDPRGHLAYLKLETETEATAGTDTETAAETVDETGAETASETVNETGAEAATETVNETE